MTAEARRHAAPHRASAEEVGLITKLDGTPRTHYDANTNDAQAILGAGGEGDRADGVGGVDVGGADDLEFA